MNRFIAEKVMKVCWHEAEWADAKWDKNCHHFYVACRKCGLTLYTPDKSEKNPDYEKNPSDRIALQDFAREAAWWDEFYRFAIREWIKTHTPEMKNEDLFAARLVKWLLAPENMPRLIAEYHGYKEEGK